VRGVPRPRAWGGGRPPGGGAGGGGGGVGGGGGPRGGGGAARPAAVAAALGAAVWSCREARTLTSPPAQGLVAAPSVDYVPSRDTLVDSVGVLSIDVAAHSRSPIDSVAVLITGAPLAFPAAHPMDTTFHALYQVPLGSLHHQSFSFVVAAADVFGRDTTTPSVTVRVR
jgi:hypothetical protein